MKYDEMNMIELVVLCFFCYGILMDFMVIFQLSHSCDFRDDNG